jgi:hypothetical protein
MATKAKGRVRVRGTCKAGHTTEAVTDPGRLRWEGPCADAGCGLQVRASRIPRETPQATTTDAPSSSAGSSAPDKPAQLLSKRQMRQTAETAVKVGTGMAHTVAAKSDAQKAVGLYLADDDDAVAIGHPLADLMHRRGDIVGGKLSPDANDFLRSLMGVAGYFTKQIQKVAVVRQLEAGAAAGEVQHLPTDA